MNTRRPLGALLALLALASCTSPGARDTLAPDEPVEEAIAPVITLDDDVIRFLEQASMGASVAAYNDIVSHGGSAANAGYIDWITKQTNPAVTPISHYAVGTDVRDQFFGMAINGPDQLRQRVALALAEIFVVSRAKLKSDDWVIPYLNMLADGAFGDFDDLLTGVAESSTMGHYLDNANNFVSSYDTTTGVVTDVAPNENFARELLQLFTIGLCNLNMNGTLVGGVCTSPYTQDQVESIAHAMSGWTYDNGTGSCPAQVGKKRTSNNGIPGAPLIPCDTTDGTHTNHDFAAQPLLSGYSTGAGTPGGATWQTRHAMENLRSGTTSGVIDNLFWHPNTAPFISKQLIQHLVTSNPSGGYVSRVANVFVNDGTGKRGNLGAVVKAILLDPDARDLSPGTKFGHLREPLLYVTGAVRMFGTSTAGLGLRKQTAVMGQDVHYSPSVFNFFPPNYPLPGATDGSVGPEFGIEDTATVVARANFADLFVNTPHTIHASLNLNANWLGDTAAVIVDNLAAYAMHNKMSAAMRTTLTNALATPAGQTPDQMRRRALYLVLSSSQYQVMR